MKIIIILFLLVVNLYSSVKKATVNQDKSLNKYCVKCHIMYYPEFLPKRSWELLFTDESLKNHFKKSIDLEDSIKQRFLSYYLKYSSNNKKNKLAKIINRSISKTKTPIRITKVPYHKDTHEDLKDEMVIENKKVSSYSNCKACHNDGYKKGRFDEDKVDIPNWGKGFFGWNKK